MKIHTLLAKANLKIRTYEDRIVPVICGIELKKSWPLPSEAEYDKDGSLPDATEIAEWATMYGLEVIGRLARKHNATGLRMRVAKKYKAILDKYA
jgi:hypothetical protein